MNNYIDIVFDGPPSHESGRFVEVEDSHGASISVGEWVDLEHGVWALRIPDPRALSALEAEREALREALEDIRLRCVEGDPRTDWRPTLARLAAEALSPAAPDAREEPKAWADVKAERERQMSVEGWTPQHDDKHIQGELADAAACYAINSREHDEEDVAMVETFWPWDMEWWKPKDRRCDLVRAGALILAEIERLDRAAHPEQNHAPAVSVRELNNLYAQAMVMCSYEKSSKALFAGIKALIDAARAKHGGTGQ